MSIYNHPKNKVIIVSKCFVLFHLLTLLWSVILLLEIVKTRT